MGDSALPDPLNVFALEVLDELAAGYCRPTVSAFQLTWRSDTGVQLGSGAVWQWLLARNFFFGSLNGPHASQHFVELEPRPNQGQNSNEEAISGRRRAVWKTNSTEPEGRRH